MPSKLLKLRECHLHAGIPEPYGVSEVSILSLADHRLAVSRIWSDLKALGCNDIDIRNVLLKPPDQIRLGCGNSTYCCQIELMVEMSHGKRSADKGLCHSEHSSVNFLIASIQTCFQLEGAASFFLAHGWVRAEDELILQSSRG